MAPAPHPQVPKSRIPTWERRRSPERWKWNGNRRGDPKFPALDATEQANPRRVLILALFITLK